MSGMTLGTPLEISHRRIQGRSLTLLVMVDALRHDYLIESDAPFLYHLSRRAISGRLQPTFGFEPDGAYLAGLYPDECDGGARYWYNVQRSPFRWIRYLVPALRFCPRGVPEKLIRKLLTFAVRRTTEFRYATVANIPFDLLPYFAPVASHSPFDISFSTYPTIFSFCSENGIKWLAHWSPMFKTRLSAGLERLKSKLKPPIRFAFWHISDLDTVGHRYGPCSSECKAALQRVDAGIRKLFIHLEKLYDRIDLIIIGDHGMVEVRDTLDVQSVLHKAGIRQGDGVLYFLDSTMARFWFFEERMELAVISVLKKLRGGRILKQEDLDRYHLNYSHNRFGDLFFLANPGVLILPNFYQGTKPVRGMHGYVPECPDQQSAFVIYAPSINTPWRIEQPVDMRRIFPTVLRLLDIERPLHCGVQSLI